MNFKKILLLISVYVIRFLSYSQSFIYHPFPTANALWREYTSITQGPGSALVSNFQQFISSDTLISGNTYHKIYKSGNSAHICSGPSCPPPTTTYYHDQYLGAIREDLLKHVFVCMAGQSTEWILYDFNLSVGDTIKSQPDGTPSSCFGIPWTVTSIDSVIVSGSFHKRFNIICGSYGNNTSIIEGVGATSGLFSLTQPAAYNYCLYSPTLLCFMQNNITIYPDGQNCTLAVISGTNEFSLYKSISVYPNPSTGQFTFNGLDKNNKIEFYDGLGRLIYQAVIINQEQLIDLGNKANGIYFYKISAEEKIIGQGKIRIER